MVVGLQRLIAVWLMAALTLLVAPHRTARAAEHDGVSRTAYGEVSANASRRADFSAPSEGDTADDERGLALASPTPHADLHDALALTCAHALRGRLPLRAIDHAPDSGPRGPPRT